MLENCNSCLNISQLPNLTSLSYNNMIVTETELQSVACHCKRLKKLCIYNCFNDKCSLFVFPQDLAVNTLLEMKQLEYLSLGSNMEEMLNYEDFCQLMKTNIKHLFLKYKIEADENSQIFNNDLKNSLLDLEISCSFCKTKWGIQFPSYLCHFENLLSLTLQDVGHNIEDATLIILANTCKQLKKLSFNFITFENVTNFHLLSSIEELNLQICEGLTHKNLRQILTEMNLIKVASLWTTYEGTFEDFPISKKIQFLNIEILKTPAFKGAYENNENLRSLIWHGGYGLTMKPLTLKCLNLQNLEIKSGFIPLDLLLQLKSLRTLTIRYPALKCPWSYISQLLSDHVSLTDFTLDELCYKPDSKSYPPEAFKCSQNIKCVKIPSQAFEVAIDFWLDFVDKNRQLKLICLGWLSREALDNLINSPKFPNSLKIIYIYGFKIVCKDLRENFDYTLEKIHFDKHRRLSICDNNLYI
ncbi:uncharacterized protein LOC135955038 [Calliphora vicina]|uniref:uncharacterized protein LOC135955038 n=1 Tax=Calliphora vicina TaxID=7373 RepID=UPI00325AE165